MTPKLDRTPLKPELLNKQFQTQTNWSVITGAPSAGKTTTLKLLGEKGFSWIPEVARMYVEEGLSLGESLEKIRGDESSFQQKLIELKLKIEKNCAQDSLTFFDRAMPDSITYYRVAGLDPNEILPYCYNYQYSSVFIFDRLPFVCDYVRTENEASSRFLDEWLELDYRALGYNVIRVPVMPVEQRVEFILAKLINF